MHTPIAKVFPACAGMFRVRFKEKPRQGGFPRVRGDVPDALGPYQERMEFSPRARGCSEGLGNIGQWFSVFPACAGMFRAMRPMLRVARCFPRVRGDVPRMAVPVRTAWAFSPRARGCSLCNVKKIVDDPVFPACAGMFLW